MKLFHRIEKWRKSNIVQFFDFGREISVRLFKEILIIWWRSSKLLQLVITYNFCHVQMYRMLPWRKIYIFLYMYISYLRLPVSSHFFWTSQGLGLRRKVYLHWRERVTLRNFIFVTVLYSRSLTNSSWGPPVRRFRRPLHTPFIRAAISGLVLALIFE